MIRDLHLQTSRLKGIVLLSRIATIEL
jgi:hypothetical protein